MGSKWQPIEKIGKVLYDFEPKGNYQIPLKAGTKVEVLKESSGWYKGNPVGEPSLNGIFPVSFIELTDEACSKKKPAAPPGSPDMKRTATVSPAAAVPEMNRTTTVTPAMAEATKPPAVPSSPTIQPAGAPKPPKIDRSVTATATVAAITITATAPPQEPVKPLKPAPPPRDEPKVPGSPSATTSTLHVKSASLERKSDAKVPGLERQSTMMPSTIGSATIQFREPTADDKTVLDEISKAIIDWKLQCQQHLVSGNAAAYHQMKERISLILHLRRDYMDVAHSADKQKAIREQIFQLVESARKMQQGFMVPWNADGLQADTQNTPINTLVELHNVMYENLKKESAGLWKQKADERRMRSLKAAMLNKSNVGEMVHKDLPQGPLHLYVDVKMCLFSVGESTELHFALYTQKSGFITENYCIRLTSKGFPEDTGMLGKMKTLFPNLHVKDFQDELYLVCRIYRRGILVYDSKKQKEGSRLYKRPFGCCAMSVNALQLENNIGQEYTPPNDSMTIWMPKNEQSFGTVHEAIIGGSKDLEPAPRAKGIALGVSLEAGDLTVLREGDGAKYKGIVVTHRLELASHGNQVDPANMRNDMYINLESCVASQGGKTSAKNVEVVMHVVTENGELIEDSISRGAGDAAPESSFRSSVLYHANNPTFDELVKLQIPVDKFDVCHLLFTFWHVSSSEKKNAPFSFGWLKLVQENGAVIPDGSNSLLTYKPYNRMADTKEVISFLDGEYLRRLPLECKQDKTTFSVRTQLCSTRKSHNPILQALLNWKKLSMDQLAKNLTDFLTIRHEHRKDLLKVLREVFETLFGVLESDAHSKLHQPAMIAVLHMLYLTADKRMKYHELVTAYVRKIFKKPGIHSRLLVLATGVLGTPDEHLKNLCQCLGFIVQIATASWRLAQQTPKPPPVEQFRSQIKSLLDTTVKIMSSADDQKIDITQSMIQSAQAYLIQTFPECIDTLQQDFSGKELGKISENLLHNIPDGGRFSLMKLEYLRNLLQGVVGRDKDARGEILPTLISTLRVHLKSIDQEMGMSKPHLCISILKSLMALMQSTSVEGSLDLFLTMLEDMVHAFILLQKSTKGEVTLTPPEDFILLSVPLDPYVESMGVLWVILHTVSAAKLQAFVDGMEKPRQLKFVLELMECCRRSLALNLYPDMWIIMKFLQLTVIRKVMAICVKPLKGKLSEQQAWAEYFNLAFAIATVDEFALEGQDKKRTFVEGRYGDVRQSIVEELTLMWNHLGPKQIQFAAQLIPLLFTLFEKPYFQALALDMYFGMMTHEYAATKKFNLVDLYAVDALYRKEDSAKDQAKSEVFMSFIHGELKSRLEAHKDQEYVKAGVNFLGHLKKMNSLMSSLLQFPDTPLFEDERTSVAIQLMNYLESSGEVRSRKAMYTRYVQFLVDLHAGLKNHVEAGMAQLNQINILDWSEEMIEASGAYPAEKERERKERFFRSAIDYFIKGEDYERALELSNELAWYYQCYLYDYHKLCSLLQDQAQYFKQIASTERWYPNYFRVVYHGDGFPEDLREKEFVCRGVKLEPVMDFVNFIKKKWPEAKIQMSSDEPTAEARAANNQIIGVTTLSRPSLQKRSELLKDRKTVVNNTLPVPFQSVANAALANQYVPLNVRTYRENAHSLGVFEYAKGVQKSTEKKPKNEFRDLWVLKTYVFTKETYPCTRRRMEVVARKEEMISPIQNALATIVAKNVELLEKVDKVKTAPPGPVDVGPLSMNLNGIIDAAVNGGTKLYIEAFLTEDYLAANPSDGQQQTLLKDALRDQIKMLEGALEVFGRRCDDKLKALHEHLCKFYAQMKEYMGPFLK